MAAAPLPPEDLFLVHPDPPSPSVFLDLPPAPPNDDDDDDDMVLPYISHLLMEEEDAHAESFFYQYPDHPALLHAQQPFADILADVSSASASATTSPSDDSDHSPTGNGGTSRDANAADMATSAFLKGMQEATNLLPSVLSTNNSTLLLNHACKKSHAAASARDDDGDPDPEVSRRATKLMLPGPADTADEADARRMFDQLMIHERDDICIKMKGVQHQQQGPKP
ncbi:hypothetical protein BDA96_05G248700 [Sorghum bicolor]|uniref:Uncharacterized protein n=1 Tax=Sorghum bicolor TaxID=4558 RepID=A0A921R177_SORBI|nr:hypothetical protein BDA96_05G248700 [Sorghum bicolor]